MKWKTNEILTAQDFVCVEAISGGILYTTNKYLFTFLALRGQDNALLDEADNVEFTERLTQALSEETEPWQLLSVPRTADTQGMLEELLTLRQNTEEDARLRLLDGEIAALEQLRTEGAKEPIILLKIWKQAEVDAHRALLRRRDKLKQNLEESGRIIITPLEDGDILRLCKIYAELGVWQPEEEEAAGRIPALSGRRLRLRREDPEEAAKQALLNEITPVGGLFFSSGGVIVGSAHCRIYGVTRYPAELSYGWAVSLMNATDCVTAITFYPGRGAEIGDALSKSISRSNRDAKAESDARARKSLERQASSADSLIDDLDSRHSAIGHMSILAMPIAENEKRLEAVSGNVVSRFAGKRLKLRLLSCVQKEAFRMLSPYYPNQPIVDDMLSRIVPLESLLGGYPTTASIVRDDHGLYFARTPDGGIISLDLTHKDDERPNGNGIVTGVSGVGKSTVLKHIVQTMYMRGVRILIIDPEREFRDLCKALGGTWWDAGGGGRKINLLQIQEIPPDEEADKLYTAEASAVSEHIQYVQQILKYKFPSLTDKQCALLKRATRLLYSNWGIHLDTDTSGWGAERFPVAEDLYRLLLELSKESPDYEDLALLLEDMAIGADAVLWNGRTDIDLSNPLVCIDTNRLWNFSETNRAAQYYNILHLCWSVVSQDKETAYMIVADEGQILMDPKLPEAAAMIRNMELRIRKYESYLWLAFHSLHEMLDDRIRINGQAILDTASYKILMGTDGKNLQDTVELFGLTQAQRKLLESKRKKRSLTFIGAHRIQAEFELPAYKLELMGKGGGR